MDKFEDFVNYFEDPDYEDWLYNEATESQREKALNIRTPLNEDELATYEREQQYIPQSGTREIETRVVNRGIITKPEAPVRVASKSPIVITRIRDASRQLPQTGTAPTMPRPTVIFPRGTKPTVIRRFLALFRRRRK